MSKQMDCNLVDMLYVLDEPSIGLHPRDTENLLGILFRLKEKGNSVFVVEHDPDIIRAAEWIVDMGPRAGKQGGEVVYNGAPDGLEKANSITGDFLLRKETLHSLILVAGKKYLMGGAVGISPVGIFSLQYTRKVSYCVKGP